MGNRNAKTKFFTIDRLRANGRPRSVPGVTRTTSGSLGRSTAVILRHLTTRKPIKYLPGVAPPIKPYTPRCSQKA